ncbi:ATP-binding protein [Halobellus rubicundus]|uniref:histidine kinase n=1 Tax=Halobellus rubicundus TaxID=2996466 RepID=A0ABD5MAP8_9EURY
MTSEPDIEVLYVNDDEPQLELLRTQLTDESDRLHVRTAATPDRGWEIFADGRSDADADIDCILCDYHMPAQTGVEFLRRVREVDPDVPFLLFTNTGDETVASRAIEAGVTDYVIQETVENQAPLLVQKIVTYVEHRRSQQEIERTNDRLREIVSVTDQVLWVFAPDWSELRFINDRHEPLFGQPTSELRADPTSFLERIHDGDRARVEQAMRRASEGEPQLVEYRVDKSEAVQLWVESRCKPVLDDDGTVVSLVGLTRDISDRKVYQQDLLETIEQLEEFASTVAHDLRNPLNIANGNIRLAAKEQESERLDTALDAITRMDTLIDEILALAKEGDTIGDRQPAAFEELMRESYDNVRATGSSLEITGSVSLECDPTRLTEAFENLVRNAVEHGGSDVAITAGVLDGGGVFIEDDGPGIPPEHREHVFDRGYTTSKDGSGFGLAIVDRIVTGHGWDLDVGESASGGARFEIQTADA